MSTIIKSDQIFTAPNLPILSNLIRDGLVLGIRPIQTSGVVDISDSEAALSPVGAPTMTARGVRVGPLNYYGSNIQEPSNHTMICGFRLISGSSLSGVTQLVGSIKGSIAVSNGAGLYAGQFASSPNNYLGSNYYTANGPDGSRVAVFAPGIILATPAAPNITTPWTWLAVSVDYSVLEGKRFYTKTTGADLIVTNSSGMNSSQQGRTRGNLIFGAFEDSTGDNLWRVEIAEALVYNRALSDAEIAQQFQDSSLYMKAVGAEIGT